MSKVIEEMLQFAKSKRERLQAELSVIPEFLEYLGVCALEKELIGNSQKIERMEKARLQDSNHRLKAKAPVERMAGRAAMIHEACLEAVKKAKANGLSYITGYELTAAVKRKFPGFKTGNRLNLHLTPNKVAALGLHKKPFAKTYTIK